MADVAELVARFRRFAETSGSPLYAVLSATAADHADVAELLQVAPETQQLPVLLFAAVHELLLAEPDQHLAAWYPNIAGGSPTGDPSLEFVRLCRERAADLRATISTRSTQTNEIGRSAFFLPALGRLAAEVGGLALLDVGTSAGLNLLLDRYDYRYEPGGALTVGSPVVLEAGTRGPVPVPRHHPPVVARLGLDRSPIDVTDDRQARWLEACVWPDQVHRFERLAAAVELARQTPPPLLAGDAVDDLPTALDRLGPAGHPVVLTSWVLNYLPRDRRDLFVAQLDLIGARRDVSWVLAESPAAAPGLPVPDEVAESELTELVVVRWRDGRRHLHHLATVHPHGRWLHWDPEDR
jgi:hypothetical protein